MYRNCSLMKNVGMMLILFNVVIVEIFTAIVTTLGASWAVFFPASGKRAARLATGAM